MEPVCLWLPGATLMFFILPAAALVLENPYKEAIISSQEPGVVTPTLQTGRVPRKNLLTGTHGGPWRRRNDLGPFAGARTGVSLAAPIENK